MPGGCAAGLGACSAGRADRVLEVLVTDEDDPAGGVPGGVDLLEADAELEDRHDHVPLRGADRRPGPVPQDQVVDVVAGTQLQGHTPFEQRRRGGRRTSVACRRTAGASAPLSAHLQGMDTQTLTEKPATRCLPTVGQGATECYPTDRYPMRVVKVSATGHAIWCLSLIHI